MTRMEKWKAKREEIEAENDGAIYTNIHEYYYIITHQKEIKEELGCKH